MRDWLRPVATRARLWRAHARGLQARLAGPAPRGRVAVWYGQPIPARTAVDVGGILKLQHLSAMYPGNPRGFNVLYLVSSRLPEGAEALAYWARKKGARLVVNQNGVAYPGWHGPGWEAINAPMRALLADADHVFYQSEFCRLSADRFAGPARAAHEVLYNAVDTRVFRPEPESRDGRLTLLLGGSQDQWYRVDAAVRALALVRDAGLDARLLITGRLRWCGDRERAHREVVDLIDRLALRDRVELVGAYTQAEAPAIFQRAHILVHTKYNDPCPAVVLEGLASGLPVAYSASGGVPELVGPDAGIGVPAESSWDRDMPPEPDAVARAVLALSRELPARAAAARERAVDRFDIQPWLGRHRDVFERLVA